MDNENEKNSPEKNPENTDETAGSAKEEPENSKAENTEETEKLENAAEEEKAEAKQDQKAEEGPEVIDVTPVNAPKDKTKEKTKKKHHFGWDTFGKVCAVAILAFACGFGGGVVAVKTVGEDDTQDVQEFSARGGSAPDFQMPSQGDGSDSSSGSGSSDSDSPFSSSAVIGITVQQKSESDDSDDTEVVVVAVNDKSNADEAGLQVGDIITEIDDEEVDTVEELSSYVSEKSVGDTVTLTYERDGKEAVAEVELVDSTEISEDNNAA